MRSNSCEQIALARRSGWCARRIRRAPRSRPPGRSSKLDALAARRILRPGRTSASSRGRRARGPQQQHLHLRRSDTRARLGLFLPMGSACTPARWPNRRAGKTRESLSTRQSPGPRNSGKIAKPRSSQRPSARSHHQHARGRAVGQRLLGDQLLRADGNRRRPRSIRASSGCGPRPERCR